MVLWWSNSVLKTVELSLLSTSFGSDLSSVTSRAGSLEEVFCFEGRFIDPNINTQQPRSFSSFCTPSAVWQPASSSYFKLILGTGSFLPIFVFTCCWVNVAMLLSNRCIPTDNDLPVGAARRMFALSSFCDFEMGALKMPSILSVILVCRVTLWRISCVDEITVFILIDIVSRFVADIIPVSGNFGNSPSRQSFTIRSWMQFPIIVWCRGNCHVLRFILCTCTTGQHVSNVWTINVHTTEAYVTELFDISSGILTLK